MRYLILSDIHANDQALEAILAHAAAHGWDAVVSLGDTLGYGTEAETTLERLRALRPYVALRGNHEAALLKVLAGEGEGRIPSNYVQTLEQGGRLSAANLEFVKAMVPSHLDFAWGAVHGALRKPWEYLISVPVARANEPLMVRPLYFVGHTHIPTIFTRDTPESRWYSVGCRSAHLSFTLKPGANTFVNPGSVGQPRDGLGASYALYEDTTQHIDMFRLTL